jgi:hypothetical protein
MQSISKDAEIDRQVALMTKSNVIEPCTAGSYSHVHLAAKPGGKWRFCIDYRLLNTFTTTRGGVIPPIFGILKRIDQQKSKYLGAMNLTSGSPKWDADRISSVATTFQP